MNGGKAGKVNKKRSGVCGCGDSTDAQCRRDDDVLTTDLYYKTGTTTRVRRTEKETRLRNVVALNAALCTENGGRVGKERRIYGIGEDDRRVEVKR